MLSQVVLVVFLNKNTPGCLLTKKLPGGRLRLGLLVLLDNLVVRLIWPPYQAYLASVSGLFGLRIRLIRIAIRLSRGAVRLP